MIPSTIPVQIGRIHQMDLDGKEYDAVPVVVVATQWDGETLKQLPSKVLVKSQSIKNEQIVINGANVIDDLAAFIGCDTSELKNYEIMVQPVRSRESGDLSSSDSVDVRIIAPGDTPSGMNSKVDNQHNNNHSNFKHFLLNEECVNVLLDSDNWAATETFRWVVNVEIWRLSVGVHSRGSITLPPR